MLEIDYNNAENSLKEKANKSENLLVEMNKIKNQNFEINLKNKKLIEENKSLEQCELDMKSKVDKYHHIHDEAQKVLYHLISLSRVN